MLVGHSMQGHGASLIFLFLSFFFFFNPWWSNLRKEYFRLRRGHVGMWLNVLVLSHYSSYVEVVSEAYGFWGCWCWWWRWRGWSKVNGWNIRPHGAGPVCWGPSGVDVLGKYTLGSGTDCMLNEVRQQVVECACVMGPCWRTLSWSNFRRVLFEIPQAGIKLE